MPVLLVRKDYLLSEAFEMIGKRLYGTEWTSLEICANKQPAPEELEKRYADNEKARDQAHIELGEIEAQIAKTTSATKIQSLKRKLAAIHSRLPDIHSELDLTRPDGAWRESAATYQRKLKAERMLIDALAQRKIQSHNGWNQTHDNHFWGGHPHFRHSIALSIVRMPKQYSSRGWEPSRINEGEFDKWLDTVEPVTSSALAQVTREDQCVAWLRRSVETSGGQQTKSKADYFTEASVQIAGLTEREFNRAWPRTVPASWKGGGRRRW